MIEVEDLWKSFGSHQVLKGLSLVVEKGETVVILGRSGVGKSVLLRHVLGLEKPDRGIIKINGHDIAGMKQKELYKAVNNMGMLFQGAALFDSMTVAENTAFFLNQHGDPLTGRSLGQEEVDSIVEKALKMVAMEGTQMKMPSDLSGGMRKRAALARLIAYRPNILLYDEPTTGLDPVTSQQINELILATQKELGATSIVVTHDINSALFVGDRLCFHHEGKIQHIAPKDVFVKIDDPLVQSFLKGYSSENGKKNIVTKSQQGNV